LFLNGLKQTKAICYWSPAGHITELTVWFLTRKKHLCSRFSLVINTTFYSPSPQVTV